MSRKSSGGQRGDVEGVVRALVEIFLDLRGFKVAQLAVVPVQNALLEHHLDVEVLEIVDDGEVGQIAGRDRAAVIEQEIARGVVAGGLDGDDGVDAVFVDGLAGDVVDVALFQQVARVLVVGAEHAALGVLRREQGTSASRLRAAVPSRIMMNWPRCSFASASSNVAHSWSE